MNQVSPDIEKAIKTFCDGVEQVVQQTVKQKISAVLQTITARGPGRPRKLSPLSRQIDKVWKETVQPVRPKLSLVPMSPAKKSYPAQLCPVLGCKKRAAPALGMVCLDHKDVSPKTIARYRAGRRYAKENNMPFEAVMANWDVIRKRIKRAS